MQFVAHRFLLHLVHQQICILVVTALLPLFFGNAISCVFENAVGRDGKCVTHPCFSSGAACLSFQRRWQLIVGCMCFGVWIHCIKWRHLLILSKKVADAACDSYLLGNTLGALWNTCAAGLSFQRRWQSLHAIWSSAL